MAIAVMQPGNPAAPRRSSRLRGRARSVLAELRETTRFFFSSEAVEDFTEYQERRRRVFPRAASNEVATFVGPRTEPCAAAELPGMLPGTPWFIIDLSPEWLLEMKISFTRLASSTYHIIADMRREMETACAKQVVDVWQDFHDCFHAKPARELVAA